jgi:hypothetical protein
MCVRHVWSTSLRFPPLMPQVAGEAVRQSYRIVLMHLQVHIINGIVSDGSVELADPPADSMLTQD